MNLSKEKTNNFVYIEEVKFNEETSGFCYKRLIKHRQGLINLKSDKKEKKEKCFVFIIIFC